MKKIQLVLFFLLTSTVYSQGIALETGYKYNKSSKLEIALAYRLSNHYDENPLNIAAFVTSNFNEKPQFGIGFQQRFQQDFEIGTSLTSSEIEPTIGLNLLNLVKLNMGYAISTRNEPGNFTFGFRIAFGQKKYYDNFSIGF